MSDFALYFQLGITHIADLSAYDHILFVVVLCAAYTFADWKKLLMLITAFTVGHSVALALSVLEYVQISPALIEFLIPVTIFITAIGNVLLKSDRPSERHTPYTYVLTLFFGLIHGLGFSNYLRQILDQEASLLQPLLAFNIGLEIGQLAIVVTFAVISGLALYILNIPHRDWKVFISGAAAGISLILISQTQFW